MNGLQEFPFHDKSSVLYLGVSTGTTISHISDIVGPKGMIFGVEHSSRVARDFLDRVAVYRKNIVPIIQDAKRPDQYFSVFTKVDVVYVDIAQPEQTKIAIDNCKMYLKKGGFLFLVIKTRSIDVTKAPKKIVEEEIEKINILNASLLAMKRAYKNLKTPTELALIDGNYSPKINCKTINIIKGDSKSLSIFFFVFAEISTISISPDKSSEINSCSRS